MEKEPTRLATILLNKVKHAVDGNQVSKSDITYINEKTGKVSIDLTVHWEFICYSNTSYSSGKNRGHQFITKSEHDYHLSNIKSSSINNPKFRNHFVEKLLSSKENALSYSDQSQRIYNFESLWYQEACSKCSASGKIQCSSCNGKGESRCYSCSGSGDHKYMVQKSEHRTDFITGQRSVHYYNEEQKHNCSSCGGRGVISCSGCSGQGNVKCDVCAGSGTSTFVTDVWLEGSPSKSFEINSEIRNDECKRYFSNQKANYYLKHFPLEYYSYQSSNSNHENFHYIGNGPIKELWFKMQGKEYVVLGHSENMQEFYKPALFDFLFDDELIELQSLYDKTNKLNRRKAYDLFSHYIQQTALKKAIVNIGKSKDNKNNNPCNLVINACNGYITAGKAQLLGKSISGLLDKLSPKYSAAVWCFFGLLFILPSTLFIIYGLETNLFLSFSTYLKYLISFFIGLVVLSLIPMSLSYLIVRLKSKKIPSEYRQKIINYIPFKRYVKISVISLLLSSTYGYFSEGNRYIPKIGVWASEATVVFNKLDKRRVETIARKDYLTYRKSDIDKISYIQEYLRYKGHDIVVDGITGQQTFTALKKELKRNEINLPRLRNENDVPDVFVTVIELKYGIR